MTTEMDPLLLVSRDAGVRDRVSSAAGARPVLTIDSALGLAELATHERPAIAVIDGGLEASVVSAVVALLSPLPVRRRMLVILLERSAGPGAATVAVAPDRDSRSDRDRGAAETVALPDMTAGGAAGADPVATPMIAAAAEVRGVDLVAAENALGEALALAGPGLRTAGRLLLPAPDRLLGASLLGGAIDVALAAAAEELAAGFGADRCLISIKGDSSGGGIGDRTWTSIEWMEAAARCRTAEAAGATLVARPATGAGERQCASYLAVSLDSPGAPDGFLGLVLERPCLFSPVERRALGAVAARFSAELAWRSVHERVVEEWDRASVGPGLDPVVGSWNRPALEQLTAMQLAASRRAGKPLVAAVLDVVDLQGINTRHGLEAGDALLRRLADAIRAQVREEDVVGRWGGDEIAVLFNGAGIDVARGVAQRLLASLSSRSLELSGGVEVVPAATVGLAEAHEREGAEQLLGRAARAAATAQRTGQQVAGASIPPGPVPRLSQQIEVARDPGTTTLGGAYRLIHEISRGGMGVVYRAEDLALERPVAIKMLRPDLAQQSDVVERFRSEAAILAYLRHPSLVQVYSFGSSGDDAYFVMELVEGESLDQAIERHRLEGTAMPLPELAEVLEQVASALDALHERGIVHRDVKPANVILDPFRGRAVLVDVGIARRHGEQAVSAGTPGFVAPEVFSGAEATPRSDVYGLAATTYATLTLTDPWGEGGLAEVLERQRLGVVRPLSDLRPELAALDEVVLGAMSVDPAKRPASASAFASMVSRKLAEVTGAGRGVQRRIHGTSKTPLRRLQPEAGAARTRGVVFRSVARAVGVREAERLRDQIGGEHPDLARALSQQTAPLAWLPTELLQRLLAVAPGEVGRERPRLARDVARAAVRASFRRFFPASSATLLPESTLAAIRIIWGRYHTWGSISSMPVSSTEVVVKLEGAPDDVALCWWAGGFLEQVLLLAGGRRPSVEHHSCRHNGDDMCLFRAAWERA